MPGMPAPMRITVQYDETLQKITGTAEEPMWMGEGGTFVFALESIFMGHPDIEKTYPPGKLGFLLSGSLPKPHSLLFDGDTIRVCVT